MREHILLKIGEFARVGQVSIATLRHYDQYGLLKPEALDGETKYRYYALEQLPRLNRILALKELGFPLEEIALLLEEDLSLEQLRGMFKLKQAQTQQLIEAEQARLARIAARLQLIEQEGIMPTYEVLLKQVEPVCVASMRARTPIDADSRQAYETIVAYLGQQSIQPAQLEIRLLHSRYEMRENGMEIDMETAVPLLTTALPSNERINIRTLPGGLMACTVYTGGQLFLGKAYGALYRWMQANDYRLIDVPRLVYLRYEKSLEPGQCVVELQFPVDKAS